MAFPVPMRADRIWIVPLFERVRLVPTVVPTVPRLRQVNRTVASDWGVVFMGLGLGLGAGWR